MNTKITREGFGTLAIGMSREAIETALGAPDSMEYGFSWFSAGVFASVSGKVVVELYCIGDEEPNHEGFTSFPGKTEAGIGIGSSVEEVKAAYGTPKSVEENALGYPDLGFTFSVHKTKVCAVHCVSQTSLAELELTMATLSVEDLEEMDEEWVDSRYDNPHDMEFESILFAEGHLALSASQLSSLLDQPGAVLIVDGNLTVEGSLSVDINNVLVVGGDVKCTSAWIGDGALYCRDLCAERYVEFALGQDEYMEQLDVSAYKMAVLIAPHVDPEELYGSVSFEFELDMDELEEEKALRGILNSNFPVVFEALQSGTTIDDEWVVANKNLTE